MVLFSKDTLRALAKGAIKKGLRALFKRYELKIAKSLVHIERDFGYLLKYFFLSKACFSWAFERE